MTKGVKHEHINKDVNKSCGEDEFIDESKQSSNAISLIVCRKECIETL